MAEFWKTHKVFRDVALAALAAAVAGISVYVKQPELVAVYLIVRAAIGKWIESQGGPEI